MSSPAIVRESQVLVTQRELATYPVPVFHWMSENDWPFRSVCGAVGGRTAVSARTSTVSLAGRPCDRCLRILGRLA